MELKKAIEVLKERSEWIKKHLPESPHAKAIDTVVAHLNTENISELDEKAIEQYDNQESLSYKKDRELPTDDEIIEKAYKAYPGNNLTSPVNAFKYGAKWMRDLIEGRPQ